MAVIVIELNGDEDIIVTERKNDKPEERKPNPSDFIRYTPQLEVVPVDPGKNVKPLRYPGT